MEATKLDIMALMYDATQQSIRFDSLCEYVESSSPPRSLHKKVYTNIHIYTYIYTYIYIHIIYDHICIQMSHRIC